MAVSEMLVCSAPDCTAADVSVGAAAVAVVLVSWLLLDRSECEQAAAPVSTTAPASAFRRKLWFGKANCMRSILQEFVWTREVPEILRLHLECGEKSPVFSVSILTPTITSSKKSGAPTAPPNRTLDYNTYREVESRCCFDRS